MSSEQRKRINMKELAGTPLSEVPRRAPVRVATGTRLGDVVTQMREHRRGSVIVEDAAGVVTGIFTEFDLMKKVDFTAAAWRERAVDQVMTPNPKTLRDDATIAAALSKMVDGKFRHLPVVDADGKAVGILSIRDLLAHVVDFFPEEFLNLPPDPAHEATGRWGG